MVEVDPMTGQKWPKNRIMRQTWRWIESVTIKNCARAVFVTAGARRIYVERYPGVSDERCLLIPNGYDEEAFWEAEQIASAKVARGYGITLLHSGTLYPSPDRDPSTLFAAVAKLRELGKVTSAVLRIVLRGSGYYDYYREMIRRFDLQDIVFLKPAIPYRDALAEMLAADGLLLLQGHDSNPAIPAKVYEYFRAGRPIFAIVDLEGDTARLLKTEQVGMVVPMNTGNEIAEKLALFIDQVSRNTGQHRRVTTVREFSRQARTRDLAVVIDDVASHVAGSKPTESR
jgi:glycosyltransferase involved in cell wall biosynthesis